MGYQEISGEHYLYINLGITEIDATVLTSRPVLDISYSDINNPTNYLPLFTNLIIDTFNKNNNNSWICKVRIPNVIATGLTNLAVTIKWERPSGGLTTDPIELTELTKLDIKSEPNFITDDGSKPTVTEPFTNFRPKKYLAIEGFMDDHPLLGKTYAKF